MEHFAVVQSIVRAARSGDREGLERQISRLRERLEKSGALKEAAALRRLKEPAPRRRSWRRAGWRSRAPWFRAKR